MFCENCGNKLPEGAKFCGGCGAKTEPVQPAYTASAEPAPMRPDPPPSVYTPRRRQHRLTSRPMRRRNPQPIPGSREVSHYATDST